MDPALVYWSHCARNIHQTTTEIYQINQDLFVTAKTYIEIMHPIELYYSSWSAIHKETYFMFFLNNNFGGELHI